MDEIEHSAMEHAPALARGYFAAQATAGALWWVAVWRSPWVREATLGSWDPAMVVVPDLVFFVGASALIALTGRRRPVWIPVVWTPLVTVALLVTGLVDRSVGVGVVGMVVATLGTWMAAALLWFGRVPTEWFFVGPFRFVEAQGRPTARHLRRSLAQLAVFWTTFFLIVPAVAVAFERRLHLEWDALAHPALRWIGVVSFGAASVLGLWSCVTMARIGQGTPLPAETARRLVIGGPYRYVRNPMALAGAIQTAAVGLVWPSWIVIVLAVAGAVAWDVGIRPVEEADLATRFGDDYATYRSRVSRWIPRVTPGVVVPADRGS